MPLGHTMGKHILEIVETKDHILTEFSYLMFHLASW